MPRADNKVAKDCTIGFCFKAKAGLPRTDSTSVLSSARTNPEGIPMTWTAQAEGDAYAELREKRSLASADQLRSNSGVGAQKYSSRLATITFLRFTTSRRGSRVDTLAACRVEELRLLPPPPQPIDSSTSRNQILSTPRSMTPCGPSIRTIRNAKSPREASPRNLPHGREASGAKAARLLPANECVDEARMKLPHRDNNAVYYSRRCVPGEVASLRSARRLGPPSARTDAGLYRRVS